MSHLRYQIVVPCCWQSPPSFSPQCLRDCKTLLAPPASRPTHFRHLRNVQSADNQLDCESLLTRGAQTSRHMKHYDGFSKLPETPAISSRKAKSRYQRAARKICCDTKGLEKSFTMEVPSLDHLLTGRFVKVWQLTKCGCLIQEPDTYFTEMNGFGCLWGAWMPWI